LKDRIECMVRDICTWIALGNGGMIFEKNQQFSKAAGWGKRVRVIDR